MEIYTVYPLLPLPLNLFLAICLLHIMLFTLHLTLFFSFWLKIKLNNALVLPSMKIFKNHQATWEPVMLVMNVTLGNGWWVGNSNLEYKDEMLYKTWARLFRSRTYFLYLNDYKYLYLLDQNTSSCYTCSYFLSQTWIILCLSSFAWTPSLKSMFPKKVHNHSMEKRECQKFVVINAMTERYRRSSIPSMQRLLNESEKERSEMNKKIQNTVPVNYDYVL